MTPPYRSGDNRFSHEVGTGYRNASRFSSRWERPEGEPHWLAGGLLLVGIALVGLFLIVESGL